MELSMSLSYLTHTLPSEDSEQLDEFCRNELFEVLGNRRRRYILYYLYAIDESVSCGSLAEQVTAWENDTLVDDISLRQYQSVYNSFYQTHLPTLENAGFIEYDRSQGIVHTTDKLSELGSFFQEKHTVRGAWRWLRVSPAQGAVVSGSIAVLLVYLLFQPLVNVTSVVILLVFGTILAGVISS
ncbi:hypothetical protein C499_08262 [Halogeometricum borinquense DSM 11551]|uniref:DUF7344 domain-containing protein n=2 Tax=Halogeometricum borinquense TaxID=60847 RepID=E4NRH1_HALBP|nr:hypothetical protein Hbor_00340 [Halogeometricum borinquense DSM 11551]ELY28249.1 hypothetical protein C499_08262 [Halogeometricum borinquense DSM 11551]